MQVSKAASFIWLQSTIGDKIKYNYEKPPNVRKHFFPANEGNNINIALEDNYIHLVRCTIYNGKGDKNNPNAMCFMR